MCVRRGVLSSPSRRVHDVRKCLYARLLKKPCEFTSYDLSIGDLAIGDLATWCLGVRAIESLDVRVATNFVMMKRKKVARNKSCHFDSSILISLAILHRMVFALFSQSSEGRNSVVLVLVEDLRELA